MEIKKNIAISESGFVFDPNTGNSFSLNDTGKYLLELMQAGKNEAEIQQAFLKKYDVQASVFEHNFYDFMMVLQTHGIVN